MIPAHSLQFGAKYAIRVVDCRTNPSTDISTPEALTEEIRKAKAAGRHAVILESDQAAATLAIDDLSKRAATKRGYQVYEPPSRISGKGLQRLAHRAWQEPATPKHWTTLAGGLWSRLRHGFSPSVRQGNPKGQDASIYLAEQHKARQVSYHIISKAQLAADFGHFDGSQATVPVQTYTAAEELEHALTNAARQDAAWGAQDATLEIHDGPVFRFSIQDSP